MLIELLVVIMIIAVLMAILMPVFSKARQKAQQSNCISNLKQIYSAVPMYSQDWDGYGPVKAWYGYTGTGILQPTLTSAWQRANLLCVSAPSSRIDYWEQPYILLPYMKNPRIWECPSAVGSAADKWSTSMSLDTSLYYRYSAPQLTVYASYFIKPTALNSWASMNTNNYANWMYLLGENSKQALATELIRSTTFTHTNGFNILFEDGSVQWLANGPNKAKNLTLLSSDMSTRIGFFKMISRGGSFNP